MGERLQTDVPDWYYRWMTKNAPLLADLSESAMLKYWLQYAYNQWRLEQMRATGQYIPTFDERLEHADEDWPVTDES